MLLLYQIIITITCWHHLFQITSLFNQFTSLLALNCSCHNFFWNVLQVWMTGKDVYLQMTWSWPDKTWNILCSYCLQWNTSQSKFRNHYFLFLFAFSILSQLFLIWGCIYRWIKTAGAAFFIPHYEVVEKESTTDLSVFTVELVAILLALQRVEEIIITKVSLQLQTVYQRYQALNLGCNLSNIPSASHTP